jgi:hypothetical protein
MKSRSSLALLACVVLSGFSPVLKADDVLYSQLPSNSDYSYASQNDTVGGFGNFATVYDNFTLAADATVTGVDWRGLFFNPNQHANITAFTINFWADAANAPGALLSSTVVIGNASEALVGGSLYDYSAAVANFAASGGVQYWLSITPDLGYPPQWGWTVSAPADGLAYQDFLGDRVAHQDDHVFTLHGRSASVPDSGATLALFGLALGTLAFLRRRLAA